LSECLNPLLHIDKIFEVEPLETKVLDSLIKAKKFQPIQNKLADP
jgi:hypothetical protein